MQGIKIFFKYASRYGDIILGLLTDEAITSYKTLPHLSYEKREKLVKKFKYIKQVVKQETLDYTQNLLKILRLRYSWR